MPDVNCIAWNFDGSNFVDRDDKKDDLKKLRFENENAIPDVNSYFSEFFF
jgi:hypothetical protein